jgi:hypothetical protein
MAVPLAAVYGLVALGIGILCIGAGAWYLTQLPEWKQYRVVVG